MAKTAKLARHHFAPPPRGRGVGQCKRNGTDVQCSRQKFSLLIPEDATPGTSKLQVDPPGAGDYFLVLPIPAGVSVGTRLVLEEGDDGEWTFADASQEQDLPTVFAELIPPERQQLMCEVPENATPGKTQLSMTLSSSELLVTVPEQAQPGDRLLLMPDEEQGWRMKIIPAAIHRAMESAQ